MNWEDLYCSNPSCFYYGVPFYHGNMAKNGSSKGQPRGRCQHCGRSVSLKYGTAYYGLETDHSIFDIAIRALAEGNSINSASRIVNVDAETVRHWLDRAAQHCRLVTLELWRNLRVKECQLDELWSFVHTKEGHLEQAKLYKKTYGDAWVWIAFAPVSRLVVAFVVGKRNQENADLLLKRVRHVTDSHIPFFTSDQLKEYKTALLNVYGEDYQPKRKGKRGPYPKTRRRTLPELLYAQVVKDRQKGRVVGITTKIIFGNADDIQQKLNKSTVSNTINTSFVERDNLTQRQTNRRLTRKTNGFSKEINWFEKQLWLSLAYYHLVVPHKSLRRKLQIPEATRGAGSEKIWEPVTPAMAAGITNYVWDVRELLSYRIYPCQIQEEKRNRSIFPSID